MMLITRDFFDKFEIAVRIALFIFSITIGMFVLLAGARAALAASLKTDTVITGDYIRLGDIFQGVKNAEYVLGPAPQPGKELILNARTLYKIASALDVEWQPASSTEQLILRREASIVSQDTITGALEDKLKEDGIDEKFSIVYTNAPTDIVLPGGTEGELEITAMNIDKQKDTFNAVIVSPSAENPIKRLNVSGRIERLIAVPVLMNTLHNGDLIGARDIDWLDMPKNKIANGVVMDESDIINMTPKRTLSGGKPIIANELERPQMVDRGDAVTLVFVTGPMILTTKGKSLQSGAIGDTVRVSNTDSNKNLEGTVTAYREVTVR